MGLATWGKGALKGTLLSAPTSLWFLMFLLIPLIFVLAYGFATNTAYYTPTFDRTTLDNYGKVLQPNGFVVSLTVTTLFYSVLTTVASLAISFPIAYLIARKVSESWRGVLVGLIVIPFWVSFVVQIYAIYPFVIEGGFIDQAFRGIGLGAFSGWLLDSSTFGLGSRGIIAPILVYVWLPFMILPLFTSLLKIDRELFDAAQDLGAGPWRTFWNVTFPLSFRGVVTGSILVFITAFGAFVEVQFFAGKTVMIGQYIYDSFQSLGELPTGAAASIFVLVFTIALLYLYTRYSEATEREMTTGRTLVKVLGVLKSLIPVRPARIGGSAAAGTDKAQPNGGSAAFERPVRGPLERTFDRVAERFGKYLLSAFSLIVVLSFYVPMAIVIFFSFNYDSNIVSFSSFSLRWYFPESQSPLAPRAFFGDPAMMDGMMNSFIIGLASTALSLVLGTSAALGIARYKFRSKAFVNLMLYTGLVIPSIVLGVSILLLITFLNDYVLFPLFGSIWRTGYESIIIGHTTFSIPIVIIVVLISLREFDRSMEEAAMDLGADEVQTFFRVTLPIIKPALISAALLAFTFSWDELIVTLFLKGQGVETLPVVFWSTLAKKVPTPELNAASAIIFGLSVLFVLLVNKVQKGGALFRI